MVHKSGPSIADLGAYKRRTGQVRACHEARQLDETWGSTVDQYDRQDVDAVVVEQTGKSTETRTRMRTRLTERQTGRKGDKQAAGAAIVVMDRAARCSQPATRNVGDPAKRLLRQNQSWLSKVRVAQLGNPTVRQLLYLGARSKLELRCSRQGAGTSVREGPRWSQK